MHLAWLIVHQHGSLKHNATMDVGLPSDVGSDCELDIELPSSCDGNSDDGADFVELPPDVEDGAMAQIASAMVDLPPDVDGLDMVDTVVELPEDVDDALLDEGLFDFDGEDSEGFLLDCCVARPAVPAFVQLHKQPTLSKPCAQHVAEFYNVPRLLPRCRDLGLYGILSLDILTGWDFGASACCGLSLLLLTIWTIGFVMLSPP